MVLSRHKLIALFLLLFAALFGMQVVNGQTSQNDTGVGSSQAAKNTVIVMGMIHRGHRQSGPYDIEHLKDLIREIDPDYVLTEIPPDRLEAAATQFQESGTITESRVRVFPEYTDALFPLTKELDFEIIPCAAWTEAMNNSRRATLQQLRTSHADQYAEMQTAQALAGRRIAGLGNPNDPVTIHTDQYDDYVKIGMEPYDRHFNDLIGEGGWSNINAGHYGLIEKALDAHRGQGKRFLITFGSWHKYYIKEQLKKRTDITLIPMSEYLDDLAAPANWNRFRLNPSGNNAYGTTEIQSPVVQWKFSTGDIVESSAVVVGETVFVGGHSKRLQAIDKKTGSPKWSFEAGGWIRATPSVADGIVYFGSDDNKFYALDASSGEKRWEFALGEGGEQSSATILDGVVYFGGFDNFVYAVDAQTGKQVWKTDVGASMLSSPAVNQKSVFIGTYAGKVVCLDRKTGEQHWSFDESEKPVFASPVVNNETVTFGSYDQHVYALNEADGSLRWKYKTDGEIFSSPVALANSIYIGSNDGHLYSLDATDGSLTWKSNLNGAVFSSPAVTDGSIYVGSSDGHLYALNRNDGGQRWRHLVGKDVKVWTSPVAVQGKIYFASHAGDVISLVEKSQDSADSAQQESSAEKIKVLIVDGQNQYHGDWPKITMMMKSYLEQTGKFSVDVYRSKFLYNGKLAEKFPLNDGKKYEDLKRAKTDPEFKPDFSNYQLVINNFGFGAAPWPESTKKAFVEFMKNGGGLVSIHAADNCFPQWKEYNLMTGLGGWGGRNETSGPYVYYNDDDELIRDNAKGTGGGHGPQHEFSLVVRDDQHPIMQGLPASFLHARDELYERLRGPAVNMTVLATAFAAPKHNGSGRHEPLLMAVEFEKGRIFHSTLGHSAKACECVGFISTLQRGAQWAATGKVTIPVPADFPTAKKTSTRSYVAGQQSAGQK